jgi:hypothetical protein
MADTRLQAVATADNATYGLPVLSALSRQFMAFFETPSATPLAMRPMLMNRFASRGMATYCRSRFFFACVNGGLAPNHCGAAS